MGKLSPDELRRRAGTARRILRRCRLCPRGCEVDRLRGKRGFCGAGIHPRVAAASIHHGEEPPISGEMGSGNVFFSGCTMGCLFCQNYPISRLGVGRDYCEERLAVTMVALQERGAVNINLVTPTPWIPQILGALAQARERGLSVPIVFNTGGYENPEILGLLEGAVDIYLPDMKYATDAAAYRFSRVPGYRAANIAAVAEMRRQVGPLACDSSGTAVRGLLIRHLILPEGAAGTPAVIRTLMEDFPMVPLSLMFQYFPAYRAVGHPILGRRLWRDECSRIDEMLAQEGCELGWKQDYG